MAGIEDTTQTLHDECAKRRDEIADRVRDYNPVQLVREICRQFEMTPAQPGTKASSADHKRKHMIFNLACYTSAFEEDESSVTMGSIKETHRDVYDGMIDSLVKMVYDPEHRFSFLSF